MYKKKNVKIYLFTFLMISMKSILIQFLYITIYVFCQMQACKKYVETLEKASSCQISWTFCFSD